MGDIRGGKLNPVLTLSEFSEGYIGYCAIAMYVCDVAHHASLGSE